MKRIVFLSGTRADYGKVKSLMRKVENHDDFELHIFVTGMHMMSKYGSTYRELEKDKFKNIYKFLNQQTGTTMDIALSNTVLGFSNYIKEIKPDLIVIHGDRLEALAGAIVGAFNNIKVAHIEGGEISGTIDESIRHAITKFSHIHLVANEEARNRIIQLGELKENIFVIGSPDIDIMYSEQLPSLEEVKKHYSIQFDNYSICMYHPVTTEIGEMKENAKNLVNALISSNKNYIVIYPNNDLGSEEILEEYKRLEGLNRFSIFPSIRFESFLTLLKHSDLLIGNSSAGVRETGHYGIPSIDVGNRQKGRYNEQNNKHITAVEDNAVQILQAIEDLKPVSIKDFDLYGLGKSDEEFIKLLSEENIWKIETQKRFIDYPVISKGDSYV
ncbi:UDP-N-acetylglucosamine 2-epimerase [Rossellomorea sp. NRS-1567]|uniref:UDP-N-acetylglucosamine 2-epimerase n=1 Tax=Rossellomorea sp. NRS-1567 TaxID=3233901 RepID=UPI003D2789A1